MGLGGFEPPTSPLSGARSNLLSYKPSTAYRLRNKPFVWTQSSRAASLRTLSHREMQVDLQSSFEQWIGCARDRRRWRLATTRQSYKVKEVIQPQVPLRLPCYDLVPVMNHTVVTVLPKVRLATSGTTHFHDLTGGVYKARERIHRDVLIRDY